MKERGWLIADGGVQPRFRWWDCSGPQWTPDAFSAIRLARRRDAEALCAGDEDAWTVAEYEFDYVRRTATRCSALTKVFDMAALTPREAQVAAVLAKGHGSKGVARELGISAKTADTHRTRIRAKLAIASGVEWMSFLREIRP